MEQKVEQEKKEIEFELRPKHKWICEICNRKFSHIEHCRDGKQRCGNCKRKMITNPFYNPFYGKRNEYVGIKSMSYQEKEMLITKYKNKGYSYLEAKNKVDYDLRVVSGQRITKVSPECPVSQNLAIHETRSELNKDLTKGLGFKEKR